VIRVLVIEDHPAMRAGLTGVLTAEPQLVPLASVACANEILPAVERMRPDVVLLDYHLPGSDGLAVCRTLKRQAHPPAVLLYSAYACDRLAIPAILAGADGMLHKSAPAPELYRAIHAVACGRRVMPSIPGELLALAGDRLEPVDRRVLDMALYGSAPAAIARELRTTPAAIRARIDRIIERLHVAVPDASW
jgi:DNA-binding NarL/FixJ family response regulator